MTDTPDGLARRGKTKYLTAPDASGLAEMVFTDVLSGDNLTREEVVPGKGATGALMTSHLYRRLEAAGLATHFVERTGPAAVRVRWCSIVPLEVVVRGYAYGNMCHRYGLPEGERLRHPFAEFFVKSEPLRDPMVAKAGAVALGLATAAEVDRLEALALAVWDVADREFAAVGVRLLDFKLEFGVRDGAVLLADEIGFDTVRLADAETGDRLDKDIWYLKQPGVETSLRKLRAKLAPWEPAA